MEYIVSDTWFMIFFKSNSQAYRQFNDFILKINSGNRLENMDDLTLILVAMTEENNCLRYSQVSTPSDISHISWFIDNK